MSNPNNSNDLLNLIASNPPKIIGGYKKSGWAVKVLDKISNDPVEVEQDGNITAKAVLLAADETYYPSFLTLDMRHNGKVIGAYLIAESKDEFQLIPFEMAKEYMEKDESKLVPFRYRTIEKVDGDIYQKNWPDFS
ncbi:MAG: hypothetical protein Q8934_14605 [Bacillota bacterium]|nr:hypothetical protein [Bacillota bacterium]